MSPARDGGAERQICVRRTSPFECENASVMSPYPLPPSPGAIQEVIETLDPVLAPLGFATGQGGASGLAGQVIFCRGDMDGIDDGCVDLVIDLAAEPEWRITAVRYWGFPSETWQLDFEHDADLADQLANLAHNLPGRLT